MISHTLPKVCDNRREDVVLYKMYDASRKQWIGSGLKRGGHGKVWSTIGHLKNALNSGYYHTIIKSGIDIVNSDLQNIIIYRFTFSRKDVSMMNIKYDGKSFEVFNESKTTE